MNDIKTTITTTYKVMFGTSLKMGTFDKVVCTNLKDALKVARLAISAGAYYATVSTETKTEVHAGYRYERRETTIEISFHPDEPVCFSHKYMHYGKRGGISWFRDYTTRFKGRLY